MNLYSLLATGFPSDRSTLCLETPESFRLSWNDLDSRTAQLANLLRSLQLPQGARVASQLEKSPESLLLYLATLRAGYIYLPLNTAYRETEIHYFLEDAEPSVMVCTEKNLPWIKPVANKAGTPHIFTLEDNHSGTLLDTAAKQNTDFSTVERANDDLAAIIYTSGTTGRSKGAMLTHGNLGSNARVLHDYWGWKKDDVLLHMLPIFHVHGLFVATHGALLAGAKMIWLPKFDIDQILHNLPRSTVLMGVPTHYGRLLADTRFGKDVCHTMRLFISGSAPLLAETFQEFQQRTGHTILERYGMSETAMLVSNPYSPTLGPRIGGTVGMPLPGVSVRVLGETNHLCSPNEIGQIQVQGPNIFLGYWRMPEKTKEEFTDDGWFKTGDLGRWGGEGIPETYLTIVGRSKDLIISGGYNVYPKEIESVIDDLSGVKESAVIGVPHPDFGEAVIAAIVPHDDAEKLSSEKIREILKLKIANYKVPKHIHLVAELPRNAMGKVQKNLLRQKFSTQAP